ncbi:MAG: arginase family protein, partial [Gemmatimonadota bacterium]
RVRTARVELDSEFPTEIAAAFSLARGVRKRVDDARREGRLPLLLAGNCGAAIGVVAALDRPRIVWFDAHGDLNTPDTTRSGFLDGMALAILTGRSWRALADDVGLDPVPDDHIDLVGARDLDAAEAALLATSAIRSHGPRAELADLGPPHDGDLYLHIDLDVLDPSVGTANPYATPGGFTLPALVDLVEALARTRAVGALTFAAYDPHSDPGGAIAGAATRIAAAAVDGITRYRDRS